LPAGEEFFVSGAVMKLKTKQILKRWLLAEPKFNITFAAGIHKLENKNW